MGDPSPLLISGRYVAVFPDLVRTLGSMSAAAVLQQIHYGVAYEPSHYDGETWTAITAVALAAQTGLSPDRVGRIIRGLETQGVLVSCQPERFQRRKWYRVDHDVLTNLGNATIDVGDPPSSHVGDTPSSQYGDPPSSSLLDLEDPPSELTLVEAEPKPEKPPRARPRNPIFDALAEVFPATTESERKGIGKVAAELARLTPAPDYGKVHARATWIAAQFDNATVHAVPKHWTAAGRALDRARRPDSKMAASGIPPWKPKSS